MKFARIINSYVIEVFTPPTGFSIEECFTAEIVAQFISCPQEVGGGWTVDENGTFHEPTSIEP